MSGDIEIKMTGRGFEVVAGNQKVAFGDMEQALAFVGRRLQRAAALRDLSARCE
jgi:hypothetical protein